MGTLSPIEEESQSQNSEDALSVHRRRTLQIVRRVCGYCQENERKRAWRAGGKRCREKTEKKRRKLRRSSGGRRKRRKLRRRREPRKRRRRKLLPRQKRTQWEKRRESRLWHRKQIGRAHV